MHTATVLKPGAVCIPPCLCTAGAATSGSVPKPIPSCRAPGRFTGSGASPCFYLLSQGVSGHPAGKLPGHHLAVCLVPGSLPMDMRDRRRSGQWQAVRCSWGTRLATTATPAASMSCKHRTYTADPGPGTERPGLQPGGGPGDSASRPGNPAYWPSPPGNTGRTGVYGRLMTLPGLGESLLVCEPPGQRVCVVKSTPTASNPAEACASGATWTGITSCPGNTGTTMGRSSWAGTTQERLAHGIAWPVGSSTGRSTLAVRGSDQCVNLVPILTWQGQDPTHRTGQVRAKAFQLLDRDSPPGIPVTLGEGPSCTPGLQPGPDGAWHQPYQARHPARASVLKPA